MTDKLTKKHRSWNMSRIRSKDTSSEMKVRSILHRLGYRYRLHRKDLPGKPDIVLPKYKTIVFVHGCFWHRHQGCKFVYTPKSHIDFWKRKFDENIRRDEKVADELIKLGWRVLTIWECQVVDLVELNSRIIQFMKEETAHL